MTCRSEITNPVKAIRAKCLDCSGENAIEVAECPIQRCPLWPFRAGKNPYRKPMSEEQRDKLREHYKATLGSSR